jgi:hypothetical protein
MEVHPPVRGRTVVIAHLGSTSPLTTHRGTPPLQGTDGLLVVVAEMGDSTRIVLFETNEQSVGKETSKSNWGLGRGWHGWVLDLTDNFWMGEMNCC